MALYSLNITAKRTDTECSLSFVYMCNADSVESAIAKCKADLPDCEISFHSVEVER